MMKEKMVKTVKLPKGFKDWRVEVVGDELRFYAVPTQEPYELKNREPMTVINGIWHCSSKDGRKNEVWWSFWDLTVEDFADYTPKTNHQEYIKKMIITAIKQNTANGIWVPKYPLSVDEVTGEVVSIVGAEIATGKRIYQAEELCKLYDPENESNMKTDVMKYMQIARLLKDGRLTWTEVCDNSSKILDDEGRPINVWNAPDSPGKMLPTGSREIYGVSDFYGNVFEILKHTLVNGKAEGFSLVGAAYRFNGNCCPISAFYNANNPYNESNNGVGAAVL